MLCPNCNQEFTTKFCPHCGRAQPDCSAPTAAAPSVPPPSAPTATATAPPPVIVNNYIQAPGRAYSPKNRWVAFFLCLFCGFLGFHRFYTGKVGTGILYLLTLGFGGIGVVLDLLMILTGGYTDKGGNFLTSGPAYPPPPPR